ncbi:MAG: hypothetical protein ACJ8F7_16365 [Gemmataceae bacterium]
MNDPALEPTDLWNSKLPDGGPRYTETNLDNFIREPWNAVTALVFVVIVIVWAVRLYGRYRQHPFLIMCLPILLAGGIGGAIYHGFRRWPVMLWLDVVPIGLLVVLGSIYLWIRLRPKWWHIVILVVAVGLSPVPFLVAVERHIAIVLNYIVLALMILVPVGLVLVRTRFRHANLIWLTLVCFGFSILFRFLDPLSRPVLPMGSHWLWHLGGAVTTMVLSEYFYRIEVEPIAPINEVPAPA